MRSTKDHQQQVGEFYAANSDRLRGAVARKIRGAWGELIEDACANAWAILLRRPDITLDARGAKWLITVAVNEALALMHRTRSEFPVGAFQAESRGHDDEDVPLLADSDAPAADELALRRIEHAERVAAFRQAKLKPREREALLLQALGYSYQEIAQLSWGGHVRDGVRSDSCAGDMSSRSRRVRRHTGARER